MHLLHLRTHNASLERGILHHTYVLGCFVDLLRYLQRPLVNVVPEFVT